MTSTRLALEASQRHGGNEQYGYWGSLTNSAFNVVSRNRDVPVGGSCRSIGRAPHPVVPPFAQRMVLRAVWSGGNGHGRYQGQAMVSRPPTFAISEAPGALRGGYVYPMRVGLTAILLHCCPCRFLGLAATRGV